MESFNVDFIKSQAPFYTTPGNKRLILSEELWYKVKEIHYSSCQPPSGMLLAHRCVATWHGPLARYVKLRVAHAPGMPGTFSPPSQVSDPDMHHGTCVTHVPWCIPGSLTSGFLWNRWCENIPGILGACSTPNFTYLVRGPCRPNIYKMHICQYSRLAMQVTVADFLAWTNICMD